MRFFITIGGGCGFALALASSIHAGNAPTEALRAAAIGCLAGALIFRAAHRVFFKSVLTLLHERAAAVQQAAAEQSAGASES
jgi:hypothetical protein